MFTILINAHPHQLTRDVSGIDSAYLAMDTEEGVEVVWNEVSYSNRKLMKGSKVFLTPIVYRFFDTVLMYLFAIS